MPKKPIKPFITYSDQINILTQKKQLNISDLSYAEWKLHDIGYYSLIDGYKDIFYNPMTRTYVKGTDFADIVAGAITRIPFSPFFTNRPISFHPVKD